MRNILYVGFIGLLFITTSCASLPQISYQPLKSTTLNGRHAVDVMIKTVTEFYPEGVIENHTTKQIISEKNVTGKCWAGLLMGGLLPCKADRFVANIISLDPFEVSIAVEKIESGSFSAYRDWAVVGVDSEKQKLIYEKVQENLSRK